MARPDDVAAARRSVQQLEEAATRLCRHFGDTPDTRRLQSDVHRLIDDLDLLCGAPEPPPSPPAPKRLVIDDTAYAHDFWMDAEDEGLGASDRRAP